MQPELLSKGALTVIFMLALLIVAATILVAVVNFVSSLHRIQTVRPVTGTPQFIVGAQILRGAVAGIAVGIAGAVFSGQALLATRRGEFNLVANTFSYAFLAALYIPLVVRLTLTLLEFRDRRLLDQLRRSS